MPNLPKPQKEFGWYDRLNPDHQRFVDEYLVDLNGAAAALRAGYKHTQSAYNMLSNKAIQEAIRERRELFGWHDTKTGAEFILNKLWDVATADARELIEVHRVPCRYCWGINGQYQWTKTEMDRRLQAHQFGIAQNPLEAIYPRSEADRAAWTAGAKGLPFDEQGGDGYTIARDPNPTCTECGGVGIVLHYLTDSRKLSRQARQLYRGVRISNKGIEVLIANQDTARDALARHYNVAVERKELLIRSVDPRKLSDEELLKAVADLTVIDAEYEEGTPPGDEPAGPEGTIRRRQHAMLQARTQNRTSRNPKPLPLGRRPR